MVSGEYLAASKILGKSDQYGDPEDFINDAFAVTKEGSLINKKYSLNYRYSLAYELLLKILRSRWVYKGAGVIPEEKKKEEETKAIVPAGKEIQKAKEVSEITDYYAVLGINRGASGEEIRRVGRNLLKGMHPDITGEESDGFLLVKETYLVLSNPENRLAYDELTKDAVKQDVATGSAPTLIVTNPPSARKPEVAMLPEPKTPFLSMVLSPDPNIPQKVIQGASSKAQRFIKRFSVEGYQTFTQKDYDVLKGVGFPIEEFSGTEIPIGLETFQKGGNSKRLAEQIDSLKDLSHEEQAYLNRVNFVVKALEEEYPKQAKIIRASQGEPTIVIQEISAPPSQPSANRVVLGRDPAGIFKSVFDAGYGTAKGKAKDITLKALKNSGMKLIKKGATTAVKAGLTKLGATALASIAGTPILGFLVGLAATALSWLNRKLGKILGAVSKWLFGDEEAAKRYAKMAALAGVALLLGGFAIPGLILLGAAGLFTLAALGGLTIATGLLGFGQAFVFGMTAIIPAALGPFLIAIIGIPFVTIIILFIINTSAYLVPPGVLTSGEGVISPYIDVKKEASPPGPFENDTGVKITYTITITAKKDVLSNLVFKYDCKVSSESSKTCPAISNITAGPKSGEKKKYSTFQQILNDVKIISPADPLIITYDVNYGAGSFNDSLITDTFTVQATAIDVSAEATGIESIMIGNPPTGCFEVSDAAFKWPDSRKTVMESAIIRLVSQHPEYAAKVCANGPIPLCYDPTRVDPWGWHVHEGNCDILFDDDAGIYTETNSLFILTHESAHHLSSINGQWYQAYSDSGAKSELPICSYPKSKTKPTEGFAEGIALYVQMPSYWNSVCSGGTYKTKYPLHWQFADEVIF